MSVGFPTSTAAPTVAAAPIVTAAAPYFTAASVLDAVRQCGRLGYKKDFVRLPFKERRPF
jgi:hypothetical protein